MKTLVLGWVRYHRRIELLAQHLDADARYIYCRWPPRPIGAPFRYLRQWVRTWALLRSERPDVVLIQNPPIFAVLCVAIYARFSGTRFIIDSHTGALLGGRWRWSVGLHRWLSRRALLTLVHNTDNEAVVRDWGCDYEVLAYTPGNYDLGGTFPLDNTRFNVAVINTFKVDEPLEVVFEAARRLPDISFYISGDTRRAPAALVAGKPDNCHLTGYLGYPEYAALLREANAVLDLTTHDHTLLMGGFEAVALGTPFITSDWPVLKSFFCQGTVHVSNTPDGLAQGIQTAQAHESRLRSEMLDLQSALEQEWARKLARLRAVIANSEKA